MRNGWKRAMYDFDRNSAEICMSLFYRKVIIKAT
jgi:hypothetical protein